MFHKDRNPSTKDKIWKERRSTASLITLLKVCCTCHQKKLDLKLLNNAFNNSEKATLNMGLYPRPKVIHQALAYGNSMPPCVLPDLTADRLFSENGAMLSRSN